MILYFGIIQIFLFFSVVFYRALLADLRDSFMFPVGSDERKIAIESADEMRRLSSWAAYVYVFFNLLGVAWLI